MPLVFVHGVNVRQGDTQAEKEKFRQDVRARDELFRTIGMAGLVSPAGRLHVENPYWGDQGARFAYDLASIPVASTETFGPTEDLMAQVLVETIPQDVAETVQEMPGGEHVLLLTLARTHSLAHAIDAVVTAANMRGGGGDGDAAAEGSQELARFAAQALAFVEANPDTSWLDAKHPVTGELRIKTDSDFLEGLAERMLTMQDTSTEVETFGMGRLLDRLKGAARGMADVAKRTFQAVVGSAAGVVLGAAGGAAVGGAPDAVVRAIRPVATQRAGIFLGDIFAYLAGRGTKDQPGEIVKIVVDALERAAAEKTAQDSRLVVVAHSMGGNIVYDILTHYRPDIQVDLLLTAGSQVALFKELGLYQEDTGAGSGAVAPNRVERPAAVGAWLNVFDPLDVLGFAVGGVFDDARDFAFSNQAGLLDAHSLYFYRPAFHRRLRTRMAEIGFGSAE